MEVTPASEAFVQQLIASQGRIYAYILSLVGDSDQADDVLQEVNLMLLRKSTEFEPGTNFIAWAFRTAFYQVQTFRNRQSRNRLIFDDDLLMLLARDAEDDTDDMTDRRRALRRCMLLLSSAQQDLLHRRYTAGASARTIARQLGRPAGSIHQTLYRLRLVLMKCIEDKLANARA